MKVKKLMQMLCLVGCIIFPTLIHAQQQSKFNWINVIPWVIALVALILAIYQSVRYYKLRKKGKIAELEAQKEFDEKEQNNAARTAEDIYRDALKEKLDHIDLLGSPDIKSKAVKLEDAFISLRISESWHSEERFHPQKKMENFEMERHLTPEQVMTRAFQNYRLLLIIGDPGSGKTTLLQFYAMHCLDKVNQKCIKLGFTREVLPIFFPLRELEFDVKGNPVALPECLWKWSERHILDIPAKQFKSWLRERKTLVLLDGLDEISSKEQRRKVCRWVNDMYIGLKNAHFVVTSRATGYRKLDGIELKMPHLRADIMDFSPDQQEVFLKKWFRAVFLSGLPPEGMAEKEWKEKQLKLADQRSQPIIDFLKKEENKALQELAAVPMLLQIMAIIWKERKHLPKSRPALFNAALNYLLAHRDEEKEIEPLLPADESRRVLAPTALWMQEELQKDEAPKETMHKVMQPILDTLEQQPAALTYCNYLRDRVGLIADYDKEHYIFRHKSFREFLSGIQSIKISGQQDRLKSLVEHFNQDWWEETLRFFMSLSDDELFDRFMRLFFQSPVSKQLDAHQQTLLQHLVREAPQKRIDALVECLNSEHLNNNQKRYIIDCLKTIGTPDALKAIETSDKEKLSKENLSYAEDIIAEASKIMATRIVKTDLITERPASFRNPFEDNVEYIKIPGGTYKYSVSKQMVTVPDLYFCKYPVTNKRYRRFIIYLQGKDKEFEKMLPLDKFTRILLKFVESIRGYSVYLGNAPKDWSNKLLSRDDDTKRFNGDHQPVVSVTWYAARAYCFWLSCLDEVLKGNKDLEDIIRLSEIYRLPKEVEWEWAARGNPDGSVRLYPWPKEKGEPDKNLANFGVYVGATTPVGRYPEGTTPHGLMDMAGNVWEWMENLYHENEPLRSLRGGSWYDDVSALLSYARNSNNPDLRTYYWGFRVVRTQS